MSVANIRERIFKYDKRLCPNKEENKLLSYPRLTPLYVLELGKLGIGSMYKLHALFCCTYYLLCLVHIVLVYTPVRPGILLRVDRD